MTSFFFFFNDPATTEIYTLSLHDALPISGLVYLDGRFYYHAWPEVWLRDWVAVDPTLDQFPADATHLRFVVGGLADRKSTRLNSSHSQISYAVFCLKKKHNIHPISSNALR